jgi:hypothetical protein
MPKYYVILQYEANSDDHSEKRLNTLLNILDDNNFSYEEVSDPPVNSDREYRLADLLHQKLLKKNPARKGN